MARDILTASDEMKGALGDSAALAKDDRTTELATARKDLGAARVKLAAYCAKKTSAECKRVTAELPEPKAAGDYSAKVAQVSEAFEKAEWKEKGLAELVKGWTKAAAAAIKLAADVQKVREKAAALETKATVANARLMHATQQSTALTAALNRVCRP
jgi:hypothetical protein